MRSGVLLAAVRRRMALFVRLALTGRSWVKRLTLAHLEILFLVYRKMRKRVTGF